MKIVPPRLLIALAVPWLLCAPVMAQEVAPVPEIGDRAAPPIEEITIVGEKTLLNMRQEIEREEENLYRLFNDLNSSDDKDIRCRFQKRRLSHITEKVCEPAFLKRQRTESNQASLAMMREAWSEEGIDPVLFINALETMESEAEVVQKVEPQFQAMSEEMLRLAVEHPAYAAQLEKIGMLKAALESARQRQFNRE